MSGCDCKCDCPASIQSGRGTLLDKASSLIYGDRAAAYGPYETEAIRLAQMWGAYLGVEITPEQVPAMMVLLKISRLANSPAHADSWVDIAGYAGCAGKLGSVWPQGEAP